MLINRPQKNQKQKIIQHKIKRRSGHRLIQLGESLLMIGGSDAQDQPQCDTIRINSKTLRVDQLLTENTLQIQGFALFQNGHDVFLWGGSSQKQCTQNLYIFDGNRFVLHYQQGNIPESRTYHAFSYYSNRYVIIFGGHNFNIFFKDWYLFDLNSFTWKTLRPNIDIGFCREQTMIWHNGRGLLWVNEGRKQQSAIFVYNKLYQFYVYDYDKRLLKINEILFQQPKLLNKYIFTNICKVDKQNILIFGGYQKQNNEKIHVQSINLNIQTKQSFHATLKIQKKIGFQSICYKDKILIVGGIGTQQYTNVQYIQLKDKNINYKRHVCRICGLYYDQEWITNPNQLYFNKNPKQQFQLSILPCIDNRILSKLSMSIRSQFDALVTIIDCLHNIGNNVDIIFIKKQQQKSIYPFAIMKLSTNILQNIMPIFINQLCQQQYYNLQHSDLNITSSLNILKLKISSLKLSQALLINIKISTQQNLIIYFTDNQFDISSSHNYKQSYHYFYNNRQKTTNNQVNRRIIQQNLQWIIKKQIYQKSQDNNFKLLLFVRQEIQNQIINQDKQVETSQTNSLITQKNIFPFIKYAFIHQLKFLTLQKKPITFYSIQNMLQSDCKRQILRKVIIINDNQDIISKFSLYYCFNYQKFTQTLIYIKGRLLTHFNLNQKMICGIIYLNPAIELDITGSNLLDYEKRQQIIDFIKKLPPLKRKS